MKKMFVLNYSHYLSVRAKAQIAAKCNAEVVEVVVPCQIDFHAPIEAQVTELIKRGHEALHNAGCDPTESILTSYPDLVVPPALSPIAAAMGSYWKNDYWLTYSAGFVVLRRCDTAIVEFELADIIYF